MARRMYDLDNGIENIKVKDITCNKITAVTSAITTEYDALTVTGNLTIGIGKHYFSSSGGAQLGGHVQFPGYVSSNLPDVNAISGVVVYVTDLKKLILWNGTAWVNLDGTALS